MKRPSTNEAQPAAQDRLLTETEADAYTGRRKGFFRQNRLMIKWCVKEYGANSENAEHWRSKTAPCEKVGRSWFYRESDLKSWITGRAGGWRKGRCGDCRFWQHTIFGPDSEYHDPNRAYCEWIEVSGFEAPLDAPAWFPKRQRVSAQYGLTCKGFQPAIKAIPAPPTPPEP